MRLIPCIAFDVGVEVQMVSIVLEVSRFDLIRANGPIVSCLNVIRRSGH